MLASSRLAVVAARRSFSTGAETTIQLNAGLLSLGSCRCAAIILHWCRDHHPAQCWPPLAWQLSLRGDHSPLVPRPPSSSMRASSRLAVVAARRSFSTGAETTIQLNAGAFNSFECNGPTMTETTVSNDDMIKWYKDMFTIRRMEIASDTMYKQREIRGFCHLYDGQEAVAVGMEAACTLE